MFLVSVTSLRHKKVAIYLEIWKTGRQSPETTYLFVGDWISTKNRLKHFTRDVTFDGLAVIRIKKL